jgi:hypothetical protein
LILVICIGVANIASVVAASSNSEDCSKTCKHFKTLNYGGFTVLAHTQIRYHIPFLLVCNACPQPLYVAAGVVVAGQNPTFPHASFAAPARNFPTTAHGSMLPSHLSSGWSERRRHLLAPPRWKHPFQQ